MSSKKQSNDLNVFTYGYIKSIRPRFVFSNIKQFFRNIKYAWQRATRGYCEWDVWGLSDFYTELMRDSIKTLAQCSHGYPYPKFKKYTDWTDYLVQISELLDRSLERDFEDDPVYYKNKYQDEYFEYLDSIEFKLAGPDSQEDRDTPEIKELRKKYVEEVQKIYRMRVRDRKHAFQMMLRYFDNLWD